MVIETLYRTEAEHAARNKTDVEENSSADLTNTSSSVTLATVPTEKVWFITHAVLSFKVTAESNLDGIVHITTDTETTIEILGGVVFAVDDRADMTISFPKPLKLVAGTRILVNMAGSATTFTIKHVSSIGGWEEAA